MCYFYAVKNFVKSLSKRPKISIRKSESSLVIERNLLKNLSNIKIATVHQYYCVRSHKWRLALKYKSIIMKRFILFLTLTVMTSNFCVSQEWLTSLEVAKRVALVQDKFLFMIWEDASLIPYPVIVNDVNGNGVLIENLFENEEVNKIIWNYFVPVKVNESYYSQLYDEIKETKSQVYIAHFNDDDIKIMDADLHIVNKNTSLEAYSNLSEFISTYALNTAFLNAELKNYAEQKDFFTSYRLASKYMDYAILVDDNVRADIINMAEMYLDEADKYLLNSDIEEKINFEKKSSMLRLSKYLLENRPRKVLRKLKKFDASDMDETNQSFLAFLYYTSYQLRKDVKNSEFWKNKISVINLKKAELITNLHL